MFVDARQASFDDVVQVGSCFSPIKGHDRFFLVKINDSNLSRMIEINHISNIFYFSLSG